MNQKEVINLADEWLKSVPDIKDRIRLIDVTLKNSTNGADIINNLHHERHKLRCKLTKIIKIISALDDENQRIICYRYFDKLNYSEIARKVNLLERTVHRRIEKEILAIGRIMFGMEDEFWNEFL